jgi:hypothetical protein
MQIIAEMQMVRWDMEVGLAQLQVAKISHKKEKGQRLQQESSSRGLN